jgi:hypothetical protein
MRTLQVNIGQATKSTGEQRDAFERLGISVYDASGKLKTAESIMPELAEKFGAMTDATQRAELAAALFGQRGVSMIQMLGGGREGLKAMTDEAERFGMVVSAKAGANAAEFNDSLTRMNMVFTGLKNKLSEEVMPIFTGVFNKLANFVAENRDEIAEWARSAIQFMGSMAEKGAYAGAILVDSWRGLNMIWEAGKMGIASLGEAFLSSVDWMIQKAIAFMETFNFRGVFDDAIERANSWSSNTQMAMESLGEVADASKAKLDALVNEGMAVDKVQTFVEYMKNGIAEIREAGTGAIGGGMDEDEATGIYPLDNANLEQVRLNQAAMQQALLDLQLMHEEYFLTEEERLTMWYEKQQIMFKGNEEALAKLDDVYRKKKEKLHDKQRKDDLKTSQQFQSDLETIGRSFGEKGFALTKALSIPNAVMSTYTGAAKALELPFPANIAAAAAVMATGMGFVASIRGVGMNIAHGGLDYVPREQTYLLDRGERVLSPNQNQDLTDFMASGGGITVEHLSIHVMENATNADAMLQMNSDDWAYIVEDRILPALTTLKRSGKSA